MSEIDPIDKKLNLYKELLRTEYEYTEEELSTIVGGFSSKELALQYLRNLLNAYVGAYGPKSSLLNVVHPPRWDPMSDASKPAEPIPPIPREPEEPPLERVYETYDPPCVATSIKNFLKRLFY